MDGILKSRDKAVMMPLWKIGLLQGQLLEDVCELGCESGDGMPSQQKLVTVFILTANADLILHCLHCQANNAPF